MCLKNMMELKEKSINVTLHKLIKTFKILIKQCYRIVWSVEKMQKAKIQKWQVQKVEEYCLCQNVQCVIVKN